MKNSNNTAQAKEKKKGRLDEEVITDVLEVITTTFESSKGVKEFSRKLNRVKLTKKSLSWSLFLEYSEALDEHSYVLQHIKRLYQEARRFMGLFETYFECEESPVRECRVLNRGAVQGEVQNCKALGFR